MNTSSRTIGLLARYELVQLFRSAQGVLGGVFLVFWSGWIMVRLASSAEFLNRLGNGWADQEEIFLLTAVKWMFDLDDALLRSLLVEHSPFVTLFFLVAALGLPVLVMVISLDQNATEIGTRGIRFLLPRADRLSLLLGKLLGTIAFVAVVLIPVGLAATGVALAMDLNHDAGAVLWQGLWATLGLVLAAIPFVSFMAIWSVSTGSAMLSLTAGLGAWATVALIGGLGGFFVDQLRFVRYLLPTPFRLDLVLGSAGTTSLAVVAMLAYAVVYTVVAGVVITRRDL